jgi:hypothetical protein
LGHRELAAIPGRSPAADRAVGRALDLFGIDTRMVKRWKEEPAS